MSAAWKRHERETAKALGGLRNKRGGDFSQSMVDVEHPLLSIECKYRKSLSKFLTEGIAQAASYDRDKIPILVVKERYQHGALVVLTLRDFESLFGDIWKLPAGTPDGGGA